MKHINFVILFLILFIIGCNQPVIDKSSIDAPKLDVIANLPPGTVGEDYFYSICKPNLRTVNEFCTGNTDNPVGGNSPYTFELGIGKGFPPFGIFLNTNGILKGKPTAPGLKEFDVCVKDLDGDFDCKKTSINIEEADDTTAFSASVDSMTCVVSGTDSVGFTRFKIEASGTGSGPAFAFLSGGYFPIKCGEWTGKNSRGCKRLKDEPATTTWTVVYYEELVSGLELFFSVDSSFGEEGVEAKSSAVCPDVGDR